MHIYIIYIIYIYFIYIYLNPDDCEYTWKCIYLERFLLDTGYDNKLELKEVHRTRAIPWGLLLNQ